MLSNTLKIIEKTNDAIDSISDSIQLSRARKKLAKLKQDLSLWLDSCNDEDTFTETLVKVYTDLETSLQRNEKRFEKSGGTDRSLHPTAVLGTWLAVSKNFPLYQQLFNNFVSVSNTGNNETLKDINQILQKYVFPFTPKDLKPKSEKEQVKSQQAKEKLNSEMQELLNSDLTQNIINSSVSKEEAQSKINEFIS